MHTDEQHLLGRVSARMARLGQPSHLLKGPDLIARLGALASRRGGGEQARQRARQPTGTRASRGEEGISRRGAGSRSCSRCRRRRRRKDGPQRRPQRAHQGAATSSHCSSLAEEKNRLAGERRRRCWMTGAEGGLRYRVAASQMAFARTSPSASCCRSDRHRLREALGRGSKV